MPTCYYAARDDSSKSLPAKHFGYWSLRWSVDSAQSSLSRLQMEPYASITGVKTSLARAYELKLFLLALHAGAHWAFAAAIPTLSGNLRSQDFTETLTDLKAGCDDAARELLLPNGSVVPAQVSQFVSGSTGNFFQDLLADLGDDVTRPKEALAPIPRRPGARFIKLLEDNFRATFSPAEFVVLGQLFDLLAHSTIEGLGEVFTVSIPS